MLTMDLDFKENTDVFLRKHFCFFFFLKDDLPDDIGAVITFSSMEERMGPQFELEQKENWLSRTDCLQTTMLLLLTSFCSDMLEKAP